MGQSAQHGHPAPHRVAAGAEPLVRQGLPAGEVDDDVGRQEAAQRGDQVLSLTPGGRDRKDRAAHASVVSTGEGGDQRRARARGYGYVQDARDVLARACGHGQDASHDGVLDKDVEQRGEAHGA